MLNFAKFWSDFGAGDDFLDPSRVEYIDKKHRYLALKLPPIDRAQLELSKSPLIALIRSLLEKIWRKMLIWMDWSSAEDFGMAK